MRRSREAVPGESQNKRHNLGTEDGGRRREVLRNSLRYSEFTQRTETSAGTKTSSTSRQRKSGMTPSKR